MDRGPHGGIVNCSITIVHNRNTGGGGRRWRADWRPQIVAAVSGDDAVTPFFGVPIRCKGGEIGIGGG